MEHHGATFCEISGRCIEIFKNFYLGKSVSFDFHHRFMVHTEEIQQFSDFQEISPANLPTICPVSKAPDFSVE